MLLNTGLTIPKALLENCRHEGVMWCCHCKATEQLVYMGIFIFRGRRDETWDSEISCRPDSRDIEKMRRSYQKKILY